MHAEWSTSDLDHRHRITAEAIYDLPFFKHSSNWFERNLAGNWQVAPIYTLQTSSPFTPQSGVNSNLNSDSAANRTIENPQGVPGTGSAVTALKNSSGQIVAYLATNPNAQYIEAGLGAYANASRNTAPLKGINDWDLTALKRINLGGSRAFEFQAQTYNVFNHSQYTPGSINDISSVGSFTSAQTNFVRPSNAAFNNPKLAFSNNPRSMELDAKFIF